MKKILVAAVLVSLSLSAMAQGEISLPVPNKKVKMTLFDALQQRHSVRSYQSAPVGLPLLSQLLWAACGYNRPAQQMSTAPSALNTQDIDVYVVRADGAYRFDRQANRLVRVSTADLRPMVAGRQTAVASAPLMLVLVSDRARFTKIADDQAAARMGLVDAGYVSQNICLACTALGLATVPRVTMDAEALHTALGLAATQVTLINHPVGWESK